MNYPDDISDKEIANIEHCWVKEQLEWCDLQVKLHQSGDSRAVKTIDEIYRYSRDLRNYTTVEDGQAKLLTEKPVL